VLELERVLAQRSAAVQDPAAALPTAAQTDPGLWAIPDQQEQAIPDPQEQKVPVRQERADLMTVGTMRPEGRAAFS
jgi:hypothetical protein